jgi:hypothetical protein
MKAFTSRFTVKTVTLLVASYIAVALLLLLVFYWK